MNTPMLSRKEESRLDLLKTTVMENKYILQKPTKKQARFILDMSLESLYGGAAGGGKSSAILMAALQFATIPHYAAIIFRRTYADLSLPGALMDRAAEWLAPHIDVRWKSQEKTYVFPSGATLSFGYLDNATDRYRYQSAEFQFIGFDELTQFKEVDYLYLFSRLRRTAACNVPLRMRAGTNPGGIGHAWVKKRFLSESAKSDGRVFIPAKATDNQHLDRIEYEKSLNKLDSFTRRQLMEGDWTDFTGNYFFPTNWPRYYEHAENAYSCVIPGNLRRTYVKQECTRIIGLDWAMNKKRKRKAGETPEWAQDEAGGPDFTAFVVADLTWDGNLLILDCVNERIRLEENARRLAALCKRYKPDVVVGDDDMLSETMTLDCRRYRDIPEIRCLPIAGKNKKVRAEAAILRGETDKIFLPENAPWLEMFCDNLASFTGVDDDHDDVPDALGIIGRVADDLKGEEQSDNDGYPEVFSEGPDVFSPTWRR